MSEGVVNSEMENLACKLREVQDLPEYKTESVSMGYYLSSRDEYFVKLRFGSVNVITGRTAYPSVAAIYSDACQLHFAPWLRKSRNKLAAYNFGPQAAAEFMAANKFIRELLIDIENQLIKQGTLRFRAEKEAGLNAKATDATLAVLLERVTALEEAVKQIHRADGKPVYTPAPITTFSPPKKIIRTIVGQTSNVDTTLVKTIFKI